MRAAVLLRLQPVPVPVDWAAVDADTSAPTVTHAIPLNLFTTTLSELPTSTYATYGVVPSIAIFLKDTAPTEIDTWE